MRALILFDLPTDSKKHRSQAGQFRRFLLDDGFDMLQFSVYSRLCPDRDNAKMHLARIKKAAPEDGSIRMVMLTENQFANMEIIAGEKTQQEKVATYQQASFF